MADVEAALVALARIGAAADEQVEPHAALEQRRHLARRRREEARRARARSAPGSPATKKTASYPSIGGSSRRRSFAPTVVIVRSPCASTCTNARRVEPNHSTSVGDAELLEALDGPPAELVLAERREEVARAGELRELRRRDRPAARRLGPVLRAVGDLAGGRDAVDEHRLDPLDVTDDGASHSRGRLARFSRMMEVVAVPPFERFYGEHRGEVLGYLRRLLGQRAEDAWQETFLRALRAYDRLEHGRHLRAWVFTIATRVAMDELRAERPGRPAVDDVEGEPVEVGRPVYAELEHLTGDLPPKERAAVVLRYGYDLPYDQIGAALGSSEEAARAAASSGVRRLRRSLERHA